MRPSHYVSSTYIGNVFRRLIPIQQKLFYFIYSQTQRNERTHGQSDYNEC